MRKYLGDGMMKFVLTDTQPDITEENISQLDGVRRRSDQCGGDSVRTAVRHRVKQDLPHATCRCARTTDINTSVTASLSVTACGQKVTVHKTKTMQISVKCEEDVKMFQKCNYLLKFTTDIHGLIMTLQ